MTSGFTYIITTGSFIFNYFQFLKSALIWRKVLNSCTSAVLWRLGRFLLQITENSPLKQLLFSLSDVSNSLQPHGLQHTPGFPVLHHLPEFAQTHVHWVNDAIQPSHLLSSPSPPAFSLSQHQGLFQGISSLHQVAKYWNFSISPSNEYSGLISFKIYWFDLLAVQGTLRSLLQHHSSKASVLLCSAFFMFQISHPYMTTGKKL